MGRPRRAYWQRFRCGMLPPSIAKADPATRIVFIVGDGIVSVDFQSQVLRRQHTDRGEKRIRRDRRVVLRRDEGNLRIEEFLFRIEHLDDGA